MTRPSWDEYFMKICGDVAERSTCKRHQFGAVIVRDKRLLATGYNGAPKGMPHCLELGCLRDELGIPSGTKHEVCRGVHAEQNAIIQCALHGVSSKDATMYVNGIPCKICAKIIINSGISRVVYSGDYADKEAFELFKQAGVKMDRLNREKR